MKDTLFARPADAPLDRRDRFALEMVRALLAGPSAFLWDDADKLADKAVRNADALMARLETPQ